ncbi:hypothetical protein B566_EDAN012817, partial [Ephemera danica]
TYKVAVCHLSFIRKQSVDCVIYQCTYDINNCSIIMQIKLIAVCVCVLVAASSVQAGFYGAQSFFYPGNGFSAGSFGGAAGSRDVGPIQFPSAPLSSETSGVVPGASGYGFVQPQARGFGGASFTSGQIDYW